MCFTKTGPEVNVAKALNTMTAALMVNPGINAGDHHLLICGDDDHSKQYTKDILRQSVGVNHK